MGSDNITGAIKQIDEPVELADSYLEIGFTKDAGVLGAGSQTGEIQFSIEKVDYEKYNQSNDYSYLNAKEFTENPNITVYVKSKLVYGDEPVEIPGGDIVYGDLNGDGFINSVDAALLSRYVLEIIDSFPAPLESADLNGIAE